MNHVVILDEHEMEHASKVGCKRQIYTLLHGLKDKYGCPISEGWQRHIEGCLGEIAFAKWSGQYWNGKIGKVTPGDVGSDEVRATTWNIGRLRLSDKDLDDQPYVLVTGFAPKLTLRGWLWGREGKKKEWWCDPTGENRPAYFVPQNKIRPMPAQPAMFRNIIATAQTPDVGIAA